MTIDTKAICDVASVTSDTERMQFKPSTVVSILDRLEAAEKDAARYRWLKTGNDEKHSRAMQIAVNNYGYEWDELIDDAMNQS